MVGMNSRLDTIQALILNYKLKDLLKLNKFRRKIAFRYDNQISNKKIQKIRYSKFSVYHQYVLIVKERKKFINHLKRSKIQFGFHYPFAIHQINAFKKQFKNNRYPNSEILAKYGISIPVDPNLTNKQISYIIKIINSFKYMKNINSHHFKNDVGDLVKV